MHICLNELKNKYGLSTPRSPKTGTLKTMSKPSSSRQDSRREVNVTAATEKADIPIVEFSELSKIAVPGFFERIWSQEQKDKYEGIVPDVMRQWAEENFGVNGVITLEPTAVIATAREPQVS